MLKNGYLAAADGLKGVSYQFIESILAKVILKETLNGLFIRNAKQ